MIAEDRMWDSVSPLCCSFARDRRVIKEASDALRDVSGNFYVNDKCTGSIVGEREREQ